MIPCLFCQRPIITIEDSWHYEGQEFPCHVACAMPIKLASANFVPIKAQSSGIALGYCSITFTDHMVKWERMPAVWKSERYAEYMKLLERTLDFQEVAIKAYAAKMGLGEPVITREIASAPRYLAKWKEVRRMATSGDHILVPNLLRTHLGEKRRGKVIESTSAIMYTYHVATKMAKEGVTLHCVYNGLDWGNPMCQQFVRLAALAQEMHKDARNEDIIGYDEGDMKWMYGLRWQDMSKHKIFLWIIDCIRHKGMSPEETAIAAKGYYGCMTNDRYTGRIYCVGITKDGDAAYHLINAGWKACMYCREPVLKDKCEKHPYKKLPKLVPFRTNGLRFGDSNEDFDQTIVSLWAWYCEKNPDQDKMPWKGRIVLDIPVR